MESALQGGRKVYKHGDMADLEQRLKENSAPGIG
jgi:hypothetical protein